MKVEDKVKICQALARTLRLTRQYEDLIRLEYQRGETTDRETVYAVFKGGVTAINVSMDSGAAMIRDIMRGLL